jgi:cell division ATPase FtsA
LGRTLRLAINQLRRVAPSVKQSRDSQQGTPHPDDSDWVLVDAAVVALTVDGHRVTDPVGFRAQEIGAEVFAALARRETIETWRIVAQQLEFSTLTLTASALALAVGLRDQQGVLLDVGGDTTDLTLWQSGCPVALGSVPTGGDAVARLLARTWDLSSEDAERLKCAYASGLLAEEDRTRVLEAMFPVLREWLEETETALARLSQDRPLPQRLYLLGGGSVLPEMVEAARALAWSERIHFERYPQVARLRPTDIPGVVNRTDLGRGAGDASVLALAAWAAQQYQPPDRPARILSELCQRF